ncbi:hypothetical protein HPB48_000403 [Haemaphysalis longicornis]|uniref:Uncharacterized protein n=1 Tax=Haemaphysalis longicornis TaxID=44386 RepID=A0A9J6G2P6_HAELO|nr:hypothetical protein HPB48_000403 [Haemaphysalis longicornis]
MASSLTHLAPLAIVAFVFSLAAGQQLEGPRSCDSRTEVWNPKCNAHCEPTCTEGDLVPCSRSGGAGGGEPFNQRICRPKCNCKPGLISCDEGRPPAYHGTSAVTRAEAAGGCKRKRGLRQLRLGLPRRVRPTCPPWSCTPAQWACRDCFCERGFIRDQSGPLHPDGRLPGR